jgi:multidrug efflux system membrane fusion protein
MTKSRVILLATTVAVVVLGGWFMHGRTTANADAPVQQPAVPVTLAPAKVQDVPVYARGLGTVQAFNTVEVKAQVNGTLLTIPADQGKEVQKGEIVAEIDPRPFKATLDGAVAQRAEDAAQLQSAELDLRRFQDLAKRQFAPQQQVDDQQAMVNKLVAMIQADTAAIETAQINLDFCTIRAPINGRVGLYQTDIGNLIEVATQAGIVSITQDKPISVVFTLPEVQLPGIQDAMAKAKLPVVAYSSDDKTKLGDGVLLTPNNSIDTTTATIQLKATFANDNDKLWPGEFVNARLLVETLHQAVTVPLPAVQHGPDGLYVYTVGPDNTVKTQAVQVGYQDADTAAITKGLPGNQNVVVAGQSRLTPGIRVTSTQANSPPAGSPAPATKSASAAGDG